MRTRQSLDDLYIPDLEWLAESGESLERVAARVGAHPHSIDQYLRRAGRQDILRRLSANAPAGEMSRR